MKILAILSMIVGVLATLTMLVLFLAGTPNSTPKALATIKWLAIGTACFGAAALAASIWALTHARPGLSAALGIAPLAFIIVLGIILVNLEI